MNKYSLWLLLIQVPLFGQSAYLERNKHIDGPANIRSEANGPLILTLNDYTKVSVVGREEEWYRITVKAFIKQRDAVELRENRRGKIRGKVKKNRALYNFTGKVIGYTKKKLAFTADIRRGGLLRTGFAGYTHRQNIRKNVRKNEILQARAIDHSKDCTVKIYRQKGKFVKKKCNEFLESEEGLIDECERWKIIYKDDNGAPVEMTTECDFVERRVRLNGRRFDALIKVEKLTVTPTGEEKAGANSQYTLNIYRMQGDTRKLEKSMEFYADEIKIGEEAVTLEVYGFGGQDESTFSVVRY